MSAPVVTYYLEPDEDAHDRLYLVRRVGQGNHTRETHLPIDRTDLPTVIELLQEAHRAESA